MKLNNQEIRNCIFSGPLNNLLKELNRAPEWIKINKIKADVGYRFAKEEIILRFFAFRERLGEYSGSLVKFLNNYMKDNRELQESQISEKERIFKRTVSICYRKVFQSKIPQKLSTTLLETLLVGVSKNLDFLETCSDEEILGFYAALKGHDELSEARLSDSLAKTSRVNARITVSTRIFSGTPA